MLDAIGSFLPAAAGVALSPFPIIAIVLVLSGTRATVNGTAFGLGWVTGLGILTVVVMVATDGAGTADSTASTAVSVLRIVLGVALLVLAVRRWRTRPVAGDEPEMPGWMASLDGITPPRAFGLGALLGGVNPKNVAFTFGAASGISTVGLGGTDAAVAAGIYVVLASSTVLGALVAHLVAGARAEAALAALKDFMVANNAVIMMVILVFLGAKLLGDGLGGI